MTIYFNGNRFQYEMENVARLFYPLRRFQFRFEADAYEEGDYLAFRREITESGADLTVTVREGDFFETESAQVSAGEKFDSRCEEEFARILYRILEKHTGVHPQWGILTGIRPVKRFQHGLDAGQSLEETRREFREKYYVSDEKIALAEQISRVQQPVLKSVSLQDYSLYISIPYCPSRCSYCSFVSHSIDHPKAKKLIPDYVNLLVKEIFFTAEICRNSGGNLRSIYIGGGTPTALSAEQLKTITDAVKAAFRPEPGMEYTIEAGRPDTITREKLQVIYDAGANRVSINPQSFEERVLEAVGRKHTAQQVVDCYNMARQFGFDTINMDLIAGLPGDTLEGFQRSLDKALELGPENITVHALSVKRAADLYTQRNGSEDYSAAQKMVAYACQELTGAGYLPYYLYRQKNIVGNLENVGYAKPGHIGLYNIFIMEEVQHIAAVGAGAVSKAVFPGRIERVFNYKYPYEYIGKFADILSRKEQFGAFLKEAGSDVK